MRGSGAGLRRLGGEALQASGLCCASELAPTRVPSPAAAVRRLHDAILGRARRHCPQGRHTADIDLGVIDALGLARHVP
jgi:hypothetical protein